MALTVTVGSASADSYASESEARTYFAKTPFNAKWQALGPDLQEFWLRSAMLPIEAQQYMGRRANNSNVLQSLQFPRIASFNRAGLSNAADTWQDKQGRVWATNVIPAPVKDAQCEQALAMAENGEYLSNRYKNKEISDGETTLTLNTGRDLGTLCPKARLLLQPFLAVESSNGRVERN